MLLPTKTGMDWRTTLCQSKGAWFDEEAGALGPVVAALLFHLHDILHLHHELILVALFRLNAVHEGVVLELGLILTACASPRASPDDNRSNMIMIFD